MKDSNYAHHYMWRHWGLYRTRKIYHLKNSFRLIEIKKKENIFLKKKQQFIFDFFLTWNFILQYIKDKTIKM